LRFADVILHAGDISSEAALGELEALGPPVLAVHGNVDSAGLRRALPSERIVELAGATVAMVHDAGRAAGRVARLRARFPGADAVVFGHSHVPWHERDGDFQVFNPGSPTDRRRQPVHTMGVAGVRAGRIAFEIVRLD
jgi:putative phosphoesterase